MGVTMKTRSNRLRTRIAAYDGGLPGPPTCPDCGAPLLTTRVESHTHALELVMSCAADCGYSRRLVRSGPRISGYWRRDAEREALAHSHEGQTLRPRVGRRTPTKRPLSTRLRSRIQ